MTIENMQASDDDQQAKISTNAIIKRKYDIYDKKIYLDKRKSSLIAFGYLHKRQHELNIYMPYDLLNMMFKFYYIDHIQQLLNPLPPITNGQTNSIQIFVSKLQLCEATLDFTLENMETKYEDAKKAKKDLLLEITEFIVTKTWISDTTLPKLINMISQNLFRSLPHYISPYINSLSYINDDEKNISDAEYDDPSWPHLELI